MLSFLLCAVFHLTSAQQVFFAPFNSTLFGNTTVVEGGCTYPAAGSQETGAAFLTAAGCDAFAPSSTGSNENTATPDDATAGRSPWLTGAVNSSAGLQNVKGDGNGTSSVGEYAAFEGQTTLLQFVPAIEDGDGLIAFVRSPNAVLFQQGAGSIQQFTDYIFTVDYCSSLFASSTSAAKLTVIVSSPSAAVGPQPNVANPSGIPFNLNGGSTVAFSKTVESDPFTNPFNASCGQLSLRFAHYELFSQLNLGNTFTAFLYGPSGTANADEAIFYDNFLLTPVERTAVNGSCISTFVNEVSYLNGSLNQIEIAGPVNLNVSDFELSLFNFTGQEYFRTQFNELLNNTFLLLPPEGNPNSPVGFLELSIPGGILLGNGTSPVGIAIYDGSPSSSDVLHCLLFDGNTSLVLVPSTSVGFSCPNSAVDVNGDPVFQTVAGGSIQLVGCGICYQHFDWAASAKSSFSAPDPTNAGQSFCTDLDLDGSWQGNQTFDIDEAGFLVGTLKIGACCGGNDCNEFYATVHPGAAEICDGFVSTCNSSVTLSVSEQDHDGDGRIPCDGDCNDFDATIFGVAFNVTANEYYPNRIFQTFADAGVNGSAHVEICDGKDNNCACGPDPEDVNECIDELWNTVIYFPDKDGDGFGDSKVNTSQIVTLPSFANCSVVNASGTFSPFGPFANNNLDCNDTDPLANIIRPPLCNGQDWDCSGIIDNGFNVTDQDGDGFFAYDNFTCTAHYGAFDCNDTNPNVFPGAANGCGCSCVTSESTVEAPLPCTSATAEVCDHIDNNCNGLIDEGLFIDQDHDGFGAPSTSDTCCFSFAQSPLAYTDFQCQSDCDDTNAAINPNATDIICNGINEACQGDVALAPDFLVIDRDSDGFYVFNNETNNDDLALLSNATVIAQCELHFNVTDCNDTNPNVHPGLSETDPRFRGTGADGYFGDHLDNDCNGIVDDIIRNFVQFSFPSPKLLQLDGGNDKGDKNKHSCDPNYALLVTLENTAALQTATNVIIKGRLSLPHDARLPASVIGDLSTYGVKIDTKTGAVTWVQFTIDAKGSQVVAIPLCLDIRHGVVVHGALNVTGADETLYDLFFGLQSDSLNF